MQGSFLFANEKRNFDTTGAPSLRQMYTQTHPPPDYVYPKDTHHA